MAIGSDSPRFQKNTNAHLILSIPHHARSSAIRQAATRQAPVNREIDRTMRTNSARFI